MELVRRMKNTNSIDRMMKELREKYIKTSKLTGNIEFKIKNLEERNEIRELIDIKYFNEKENIFLVKIKMLEKKIKELIKEEIDIIIFLEKYYFEEKIETKKEKQNKEKEIKEEFFEKIKKDNEIIAEFIEENKKNINMLCKKNEKQIEEEAKKIKDLANVLPIEGGTTLPFLANELFKDSHALDIGSVTFNLLLQYICFKYDYQMEDKSIEEKNKILSLIGIKRDEISNNFMTYNLKREKDLVLLAADEENEVYIINLKKIQKNEKKFEAYNNQIFIVENNIVFQKLTEDIATTNEKVTIICSSGQFNTAFLEFLKKLKEETVIYYAGDYDPEGLVMLDSLMKKKDKVEPLLMEKEIYKEKRKTKIISEKRLKSLVKLELVEKELIKEMEKEKKALYQEEIYDFLFEKIMCITKENK